MTVAVGDIVRGKGSHDRYRVAELFPERTASGGRVIPAQARCTVIEGRNKDDTIRTGAFRSFYIDDLTPDKAPRKGKR